MSQFVWDVRKELANLLKHGVDFTTASKTFADPQRKIFLHWEGGKSNLDRTVCLSG